MESAQMEYYINKDANVARKIYEMGFKKFSQETAFVFQYIDFLFHRSDENSKYYEGACMASKLLIVDRFACIV